MSIGCRFNPLGQRRRSRRPGSASSRWKLWKTNPRCSRRASSRSDFRCPMSLPATSTNQTSAGSCSRRSGATVVFPEPERPGDHHDLAATHGKPDLLEDVQDPLRLVVELVDVERPVGASSITTASPKFAMPMAGTCMTVRCSIIFRNLMAMWRAWTRSPIPLKAGWKISRAARQPQKLGEFMSRDGWMGYKKGPELLAANPFYHAGYWPRGTHGWDPIQEYDRKKPSLRVWLPARPSRAVLIAARRIIHPRGRQPRVAHQRQQGLGRSQSQSA